MLTLLLGDSLVRAVALGSVAFSGAGPLQLAIGIANDPPEALNIPR
jgi:hypothetical protein